MKPYSSVIAEALEEMHRPDALISFIVPESPAADARSNSIDERLGRVDRELGALRRHVGLIFAELSST